MRDIFLRAMWGGVMLAGWSAGGAPAWGQMHKVAKPEQVVRAVGVYEWTGDMNKPTASRLIPVSIFIDGKLEDAGVYVARPVPFALLSGNVYELQDGGVDKGMLDLVFARHLQAENATGDMAYDDGWFGYGSVKPLAAPKKVVAKLKPSKTLPVLTSSTGTTTSTAAAGAGTASDSANDPDRPTMKRRSSGSSSDAGGGGGSTTSAGTSTTAGTSTGSGSAGTDTASTQGSGSGTGSTPADDPDRPTMKRRSDGSGGTGSGGTGSGGTGSGGTGAGGTTDSTTGTSASTTNTGSSPGDDPDRPTMKRRSSDDTDSTTGGTASSGGSSGSTGSVPADDPDRPTLKRHSAADAKRASGNDVADVSGTGALNDDPDRPNLHHGKPTRMMTETELPKLVGLPADLHQMIAVSDAVNREPHEFAREFDDATQRAAVLAKMQEMARAKLAAYKGFSTTTPALAPAVKKTSATATSRRVAKPAAAAPVALMDEQLKAYTLSYGGAATYVYSAHTAGTGATLRYVTVVAQADGLGELKPAIQNVTDAAHLDETPRMRLVGVVDVEASNRASLLFELRGQSSRQFGLYRVIAAHSDQIFLTGTTQ